MMPVMHVASALISGVYPTLILEKIIRGKVVMPGPDVKLARIKSSKEMMYAINQLAMMDGMMMGN